MTPLPHGCYLSETLPPDSCVVEFVSQKQLRDYLAENPLTRLVGKVSIGYGRTLPGSFAALLATYADAVALHDASHARRLLELARHRSDNRRALQREKARAGDSWKVAGVIARSRLKDSAK